MKKKIIFIVALVIWIVLSGFSGHYISILIHNIGATRITVKDILGCYIFPALIWAFITALFLMKIEEKIK
ncbi:hypothetical protein [uncultured Clostridium sp.]|uniref:hypothetical protein n=1 Tax=uncultured Clostridium sp. TaxID=59620 RepID=UPI0026203CE3|nr:hypothetical protein [uncultured Clostridium sp.]